MDNEYLKRIYGLLESGATLGTGAVSGLVGLPYGLYKGVTSGAYGTPEAPRIAAREAQQFMERNTYQPRTAEGQENLRQIAGLLEASKLPPVMPEASLLAAIPKQAYAAQAERAGMAAEKAIAPVVTRTMERGGLPAQLLGDLSQGSIRPMDVWHGSPHGPFTKFDPAKIGSGEGAQAYSYGHYFGEARNTGEEYRKALTGNHNLDQFVPTVDGQTTDSFVAKAIIREGGNPEPFIAKMQSKLEKQLQGLEKASKEDELGLGVTDYDMALMDVNQTQKIIDEASSYIGKTVKNEQPGYLYKVDLPDEAIANMLDWDKPYNKQPKQVQDALKNSNVADIWKSQIGHDIEKNKPQMDMVYKVVSEQLGSDAAASQYFKDLGIPGMRYKDAESRNIESGTSNFVVFPGGEDLLTIKEINDKPVGGLLGQSKAAESAPITTTKGLPVGASIKSVDDFAELASKGKVNMAKSQKQEIADLVAGKSKFAEANLNWDMPETYDLADDLAKKGFKSKVDDRGITRFYKSEKDLEAIESAQTPADYGKAYGYSDEDIAAFYLKRRGGDKEAAYQDFLADNTQGGLLGQPKAASKIDEPMRTFKTSDGFTLYETKDGKIVDNLDPDAVDMSWDSYAQLKDDFGDDVYQIGDELGARKAMVSSFGTPNPSGLIDEFSAFMETPTPDVLYQQALNKQNALLNNVVPLKKKKSLLD